MAPRRLNAVNNPIFRAALTAMDRETEMQVRDRVLVVVDRLRKSLRIPQAEVVEALASVGLAYPDTETHRKAVARARANVPDADLSGRRDQKARK